jgi:hypothetical protein
MKVFNCKNCNKQFESNKSCKSRIPKFCSRKCAAIYNVSLPEVKEKMSIAKIGRIPHNKLETYKTECLECKKIIENKIYSSYIKKYCSRKCRDNNYKKRDYSHQKGINSHLYIHGNTTENEKDRKSAKYRNWRNLVFKRDNYTCQICTKKGGLIHADHIKPFAYYKELRHDVNNGRTLCVSCHKKNRNIWK